MDYHFNVFAPFMTTGIGSLPHRDPDEACRLILDTCDIPFWPQLPNLSFYELMIPQFSEGMPFLKVDAQRKTIRLEKNMSDDLMRFYENYSDEQGIAMSQEYSQGFFAFLRKIEKDHRHFLKGQVTGPLTFTLGIKESGGRHIYFDEELREVALMVLKAKARWQIKFLRPYTDNVVIFIDEPILSALGSTSYIGVSPAEAFRLLREIVYAVKQSGGIPGIHCCGKADWPLIIKSGVTIISFDAYDYAGTISLYPEEFSRFLNEGGYFAWGVVPTTDAIREENLESIRRRFESQMDAMSDSLPGDLLHSQVLLTPSCGAGSRSIEETLKIFDILKELSNILKDSLR
ncbi:MAG: hypothetical protein AB1390_05240 [Nitrospirota bacterium]